MLYRSQGMLGTLIRFAFTGIPLEFRAVEGYSRKVRLAIRHLQVMFFTSKRWDKVTYGEQNCVAAGFSSVA